MVAPSARWQLSIPNPYLSMKNPLLILTLLFATLLGAREPMHVSVESAAFASKVDKAAEELQLIYHWLANTSETRIHQMRGATENKLYLHEDGQMEAVYDGEGKLVKDGINDGSYNYAHPTKDPVNHFKMDILPWIFWGNSRTDPTSIDERITAYSEALGGGLVAAQAQTTRVKKADFSQDELVGIATIMRVIEAGDIEEVYSILKDPDYQSKEPYKIGDGLTKGLMVVIKGKSE